MPALVLDPARSSILVRTSVEGALSRFAHDLELRCGSLEAGGTEEGIRLTFPVSAIRVEGSVRDGRVDPDGLSEAEKKQCLEKMCRDVFCDRSGEVVVRATRDGRAAIAMPGRSSIDVGFSLQVDGLRATGTASVSILALGGRPVKGPMNVFRVRDAIEIRFDLIFLTV